MTKNPLKKRVTRRVAASLAIHGVVFALVYWLAFFIRFDFAPPAEELTLFWFTLPAVWLIKMTVFYALGHCHVSWRHVTFSDLSLLLRAATLSVLAIATLQYFFVENTYLPRTVLLLDWGLTIIVLGGLRAVWRLSREELIPKLSRKGYRGAFIVGANHAGESLARQLQVEPQLRYTIAGFLDSDVGRHGSMISGVPILGRPEDAPRLAPLFGVEDVLVVSGQLSGKQMRYLMEQCTKAELNLRVLPSVDELLKSNYHIQVRDVDINDLLRRDPVQLNSEAIGSLLENKTILVTGAGGSIGSEICRQVLRFSPRRLILMERAENSLFIIEQELLQLTSPTELVPCIADISDRNRLDHVLATHRPDVIFHAAAHKHVPMMEANPGEAIKNNVMGTRLLVEAADRHEVSHFVMISTDKAVNPTSIMGVSKQLAERYVHAYTEVSSTKFVVVRFGNVLGSNGSVVPIFREQIRRGGPITVTHPDIERFFMTIPEASQLVLQAAAMGSGGEIFVLDMGEPVRIVDLAQDLIRLSGFSLDDIEIMFTGLRPGEKLYEELYFGDEQMLPTPHPKLFAAYHRPYTLVEVRSAIDELSTLVHEPEATLRGKLQELVPEYQKPGIPKQASTGITPPAASPVTGAVAEN